MTAVDSLTDPGCGQVPQTTHTTVKITNVKDLALIFLSVSLAHRDFVFCQKPLGLGLLYTLYCLTS